MHYRPLPMSNSEIATAYVRGMPMCDLVTINGCTVDRIKTILRAYDVKIRTRSEATNLIHRTAAEKRDRRLARARALGGPHD